MTPSLTQSVTELMTTPVHSVNADTSVADAAEILLDENIGSVIVKDPAGILTKLTSSAEFAQTRILRKRQWLN